MITPGKGLIMYENNHQDSHGTTRSARKYQKAEVPEHIANISHTDLLREILEAEPGSLAIYSRFHDYSPMNELLLRIQGLNEPGAKLKRWNELGFADPAPSGQADRRQRHRRENQRGHRAVHLV